MEWSGVVSKKWKHTWDSAGSASTRAHREPPTVLPRGPAAPVGGQASPARASRPLRQIKVLDILELQHTPLDSYTLNDPVLINLMAASCALGQLSSPMRAFRRLLHFEILYYYCIGY